jgi:hypothetical protein
MEACVDLYRVPSSPVNLAESQPALKVSFNRPRPRSQPSGPAGRVCWLFIYFSEGIAASAGEYREV